MVSGIVIRKIVSLIDIKDKDFVVFLIDEGKYFVIFFLLGYLGRVNELIYLFVNILKFVFVIIISLDVIGKIVVDIIF